MFDFNPDTVYIIKIALAYAMLALTVCGFATALVFTMNYRRVANSTPKHRMDKTADLHHVDVALDIFNQ